MQKGAFYTSGRIGGLIEAVTVLNAVYFQIIKGEAFSNKLANVYRYIIFNSNKNLVSLADELSFAKDYAFLQEIRHSGEVQIQFSVPQDVANVFVLPVSL